MHNIFQFIILLISNKTLWQNFKNHGWTWNQLLQHSRECLDTLNVIDWGVIDWDQSSLMEDWLIWVWWVTLISAIDCKWLFLLIEQTDDGEDDMKKGTQLLEIYALEIQMYTAQKNNKKLKVGI